MLVKIKSIEEINEYKKDNSYPSPGFITEEVFWLDEHCYNHHSMEYYCGKIIELNENNRFGGWIWANWMFEKASRSLDIE